MACIGRPGIILQIIIKQFHILFLKKKKEINEEEDLTESKALWFWFIMYSVNPNEDYFSGLFVAKPRGYGEPLRGKTLLRVHSNSWGSSRQSNIILSRYTSDTGEMWSTCFFICFIYYFYESVPIKTNFKESLFSL